MRGGDESDDGSITVHCNYPHNAHDDPRSAWSLMVTAPDDGVVFQAPGSWPES